MTIKTNCHNYLAKSQVRQNFLKRKFLINFNINFPKKSLNLWTLKLN